ncbi:hypothetical protein BGC33_06235 [Bathymodiolus thermophilus thioautotrophic gill symbiont]|uniref:DUF4062 domain-containing protein n=1 Tax=Bathymodiolus thermophilus thioautotrophic gill symbiont TaxID=2360 RepID=A0A1J5UM92_9GAMM|nr:hypothetical protein BGC33_06235 [Bathymodiolus thermophilus thioautotrophic gill symbiont]
MPKGSNTSLFISSTCYDLAQIRTDLRDFALSIGFEPILSDFDSFPVNPSQNTLENCLEAVRNNADIFLLIVGGRYGSITETGKSITNLEFSEANAKGIPKYVFVKDDILSLLPVWKDNPDVNFESVVDTPKLLEFILTLRDSGEIWVYPFSNAQDIVRTLRKQLSYLFAESLDLRKTFYGSNENISNLESKALRLVIENPRGWECLLFAQVLKDQIKKYSSKRLDAELGISFGEPITLDEATDAISWVSSRLNWIANTIDQLSKALNNGFIKAVGEPGEPGDIQRIVHLATRVGDGYGQLLDWRIQFERVSVDDEFERLIYLVSNFSTNATSEIEEFTLNLYNEIEGHIVNMDTYDDTVVTITLTLTAPDTDELNNEIARLCHIYE